MEKSNTDYNVYRILKALRKGAFDRNMKTLLILLFASSGFKFGLLGLGVTAVITLMALGIASHLRSK